MFERGWRNPDICQIGRHRLFANFACELSAGGPIAMCLAKSMIAWGVVVMTAIGRGTRKAQRQSSHGDGCQSVLCKHNPMKLFRGRRRGRP